MSAADLHRIWEPLPMPEAAPDPEAERRCACGQREVCAHPCKYVFRPQPMFNPDGTIAG